MAPVDRRAQRLLPLRSVARAGGEELQRVVEALEQRLGREDPDPGGGELEREGKTVEASADRSDRFRVLWCQREGVSGRPRALDEQCDRRIGDERLRRAGIRRWRKPERGERVLVFGGDPERRSARRHNQ